jgi:dihydroorotase-like cyclic amidohydrolase
MAVILDLCAKPHVTGELVSTMLRPGRGSREGLTIGKRARQLCFDALHNHTVNILVSDGQHQATMKGFGDTRDNVPAILELVQQEILGLPDAVATMTQNPARLLAGRTGNTFWTQRFGHLGTGALANVTIVNPSDKTIPYTIVNGQIVSFENRLVRGGMGAGNWVCAKGMVSRFGAGDIAMFRTEAEP